jgi:hypothetical protein
MWVLILFAYAGTWADSDSVSLTSIPNFATEQVCITAGNKSKELVKGTKKDLRFVCLKADK